MRVRTKNQSISLGQLTIRRPLEFLVEERVDALVHSMAACGQRECIYVSPEYEVIDGFSRLIAAHRLGWKLISVNYFLTNEQAWQWACIHSPPRPMHEMETAYTITRASQYLTRDKLTAICSKYKQRKYVKAYAASGLQIRDWRPT